MATTIAAAGWLLRDLAPWSWPLLLAATAAVATAIAWRGTLLGLDRPVERRYAAAVVTGAGGWLAAATALGPARAPLPLLLWAGTITAAVPWWWHRRRRGRVRVVRAVERWRTAAEAAGLAGSRLQRVTVARDGTWTATLLLRPGHTVDDVLPALPRLESALALRRGALEASPDPGNARRVHLRVAPRDNLDRALPWPGPDPGARLDLPVSLGRYQDGTPCTVPLAGEHALIAGATGSGKSGVLHVLLGHLAASPDVVCWGVDLKGGAELALWRPALARLATTPDEAGRLLGDAVQVIHARARHMAEQGWQTWPVSPEQPALVIVVDEQAQIGGHRLARDAITQIVALGRAVRVQLVSATQYPTREALGSRLIATQMGIRIALRLNGATEVTVALGPGAVSAGWHAHRIPRGKPGLLYLMAPGAEHPRLARAWHVTDSQARRAAAAARLPALDAPSAQGKNGTLDTPTATPAPVALPTTGGNGTARADAQDLALLRVLASAPAGGLPAGRAVEMLAELGLSRTIAYEAIRRLLGRGEASCPRHGWWQITPRGRERVDSTGGGA